jgi:hypothetical protein
MIATRLLVACERLCGRPGTSTGSVILLGLPSGGVSPLKAPRELRSLEATFANAWFSTITTEVFG